MDAEKLAQRLEVLPNPYWLHPVEHRLIIERLRAPCSFPVNGEMLDTLWRVIDCFGNDHSELPPDQWNEWADNIVADARAIVARATQSSGQRTSGRTPTS
jgi:hypothetical protein